MWAARGRGCGRRGLCTPGEKPGSIPGGGTCMAHRSRRAGRAITVALASTLGALAPITLDSVDAGWQVAGAAGLGNAASADSSGRRGGAAAPRSESARPAGGAGGYGPRPGGVDGSAPGRGPAGGGAPIGEAPGSGAPSGGPAGGAPSGEAPGVGAPDGGPGAVGRRGTDNRGTGAPDKDGGPAGGPVGARGDEQPTGATRAPVRRTGRDLARELEQIGADLSPAEEAALIADRWR